MIRLSRRLFALIVICISYQFNNFAISSLANNDPYPIYTAIYDPYMITWTKEWLRGCNSDEYCYEFISLAISPFYQHARRGRTFAKEPVNVGDIAGFWNMLGMLYGNLPGFDNSVNPPVQLESLRNFCTNFDNLNGTQLGNAKINIFADYFAEFQPNDPNANTLFSEDQPITKQFMLTSTTIGHFSVPIKYRKIGVRFEVNTHPFDDWGITIQGGVSEIRQTLTEFINLNTDQLNPPTCEAILQNNTEQLLPEQAFPNNFCRNIPLFDPTGAPGNQFTFCPCDMATTCSCTTPLRQIQDQLMDQQKARLIFRQIGLDDCDFEKTSFEDVRFIVWWRHLFEVNRYEDPCEWPWFFITPSFSFNVTAPVSREKDRKLLFSAPFGNDGHWAFGFDAGLSIDFVETVEIAFYGGLNAFTSEDKTCYRLPTHHSQSGVFPFATTVNVKPGFNFNMCALLHAYHFLSKLSAYAQWVMVKHEQDRITLKRPEPVWDDNPNFDPFLLEQAECITKFTAHFVNAALYYDISRHISLGAIAQFPIAQRNAYKSTTFMGTFRIVF